MPRLVRWLLVLAWASPVLAQQLINPTYINWPVLSGAGVPTASCTAINLAEPYLNIAVLPNTSYACSVTGSGPTTYGWVLAASGGGGGATLPYPGLVWATSSVGGTVATSTQVVSVLNASPSSTFAPALIANPVPYVITPSAAPALSAALPLQIITLNANAVPSIIGITSGQHVVFVVCQPVTGGPYTWTWPSPFHGAMIIGTIAGMCSKQAFDSANGSTMLADGTGVINVAP